MHSFRHFLLALLLGFIPITACADATEERRLTISVSIFPKIVALDVGLANKANPDGSLTLGIIHFNQKHKADEISSLVQRKVKNIAGKSIHIKLISEKELIESDKDNYAGLLLIEPLSDEVLKPIIDYATKKQILLFSPFDGDIERGVSAGIFVGSKIRPYFNLNSLKKSRIELKSAILGVSKTYE